MRQQVFNPFLDTADYRVERLALESASMALDKLDLLKQELAESTSVDSSVVDRIHALCPENVSINLPQDTFYDLPDDVWFEQTSVAVEFIGIALAAVFVAALIALVLKIREYLLALWRKIAGDSKSGGVASVKVNLNIVSDNIKDTDLLLLEFANLTRDDPDTLRKMAAELAIMAKTADPTGGVQSSNNLDALADSFFYGLTRGSTSRVISDLAKSENSIYTRFYEAYKESMLKRIENAHKENEALCTLLKDRTEFNPEQFHTVDEIFPQSIKLLAIGTRVDDGLSENDRALIIQKHITAQLQTKDTGFGLSMKESYSNEFDFNAFQKVGEHVLEAIEGFDKIIKSLEAVAKEKVEANEYRQQASKYVMDTLNATTSMSATIGMMHASYITYTEARKTASNQLITGIMRLSSIVLQSKVITPQQSAKLSTLLAAIKARYEKQARVY